MDELAFTIKTRRRRIGRNGERIEKCFLEGEKKESPRESSFADELRRPPRLRPALPILQWRVTAAVSYRGDVDVEVAPFSRASSLISPLFGCLGIAFKFAEMDYVAKENQVDDLSEASKSIMTLQALLNHDIEKNSVKKAGSHSRNLLRVKHGLDMVRVLFEQILVSDGNSLRNPTSKAYADVFAPYHGWAIRKAVGAGMYALPTKAQLLKKLNEDEASAKTYMEDYVVASVPLIKYIDELFLSRELGIDW